MATRRPVSPVRVRRKGAGGTDGQHSELVSVVLPAHNAEATIGETLLSVRNQAHDNIEIIVVDDGSTDRTVEIVAGHAGVDSRIRLLSQTNGGVAAARNAGISAARGDLVALIDSDDLWRPNKIERQLRALRATGDEVALVYCWSALIDADGRTFGRGDTPHHVGDVLGQLCYGNFVGNGSSALMRKSAVLEAGGFDPSLRERGGQGCEDWRLYFAIAERWHFALVPDHLTGYRQVAGAMSADVEQMLRSDALVRAEMLERHPEYREHIGRGRKSYIHWLLDRELECRNWDNCMFLIRASLIGQGRLRGILRLGKFLARMVKRRLSRSRRVAGPRFLPRTSSSDLAAVAVRITAAERARAAGS